MYLKLGGFGADTGVADVYLDEDSDRWSPCVLVLRPRVVHGNRGALDDHGGRLANQLQACVGQPLLSFLAHFFDGEVELALVVLEIQPWIHGQITDPSAVRLGCWHDDDSSRASPDRSRG